MYDDMVREAEKVIGTNASPILYESAITNMLAIARHKIDVPSMYVGVVIGASIACLYIFLLSL